MSSRRRTVRSLMGFVVVVALLGFAINARWSYKVNVTAANYHGRGERGSMQKAAEAEAAGDKPAAEKWRSYAAYYARWRARYARAARYPGVFYVPYPPDEPFPE